MAKMDKYEEMFEGLDLSDEFKRSFLMAKGIDVSEPEEVVAAQEPSASLVNTPVQEKQQESVDETKTTTPIPTKVQPQTSESKVFYKDVTEKIEASLADEYENIVKEKNHLLSTYDPDLSISLKEDVNQFFNPTMAEPQKKSIENKPIKIEAQSMHKEMLGVENNKAIENVVEESTEIKPVEIEAEDNKVAENVVEENIETKDERVKVLKEFEQEKIEDQDLLLDDDLLDLDVDFAFDLDAELDEIDKLEKMLPKKDNSGVKEKVVIEKPDFSNRVENEDLKVYDNFYYLKELNPSLYTKIKQTESTLIHDHVKTVQEFSGVIETFCKDVINADLNTICSKKALGTSFNYERVISMDDANIVSLKDIETLNHQLKNNVSLDSKYTTLVNDKNVISGNVLRNGLKSLDVVLRAFYKVNDKKKWLKDSTKIDAYDIYKVTTTAPGCKKEYYGIDSSVTPNAYAVIKEYDVQNMDMNFVKRNMSVLERIHSNTMDPIEGIADIKQLNEVNTEDESYYVSYVFHKQPMELSQENLNRADTPFERVQMCKRLSNAISQLHNLEEPIYHRLINAKSVVLCDFSDKKFGIVPYLINFDFSKFKAADAKMTVLEQFKNEVDSLKQEDMEYICEYDMTDTSYEKMDIYALGILFIRILSGDLQSPRLDLADKLNLIEENYNSKIADLLEMMLSEIAIDRPTAKQVYAVFMEAYSSVSSEKNDAIIVTPKELKENDDVLNGDADLDFNYEEAIQDLSDNENTKESYIIPMDVEREEDDEIVEEEEVVSKKEKLDFSYHEPNTPIEIKDNFAYLKDHNMRLYNEIKTVESGCIKNHFTTAEALRGPLDIFLNTVIKESGLEGDCVKEYNSNSNNKAKNIEGVSPAIKINFITVEKLLTKNTKSKIIRDLNTVRRMANLGAHKESIANSEWKPFRVEKNIDGEVKYIINGKVLKDCFGYLNNVFRLYYGEKNAGYNRDTMKLDDYDIYDYAVNEGDGNTRYLEEFHGIKQGKKNEYAIIRKYDKEKMDKNFIQRNISTLELINDNMSNSIKGVSKVKDLNKIDSEDDEFYYIAYTFSKEPMALNQQMLDKIKSSAEKVNICTTLSEAISKLHDLEEPIYHRMINPGSIIVCDYGLKEGYVPYLIGFDFSKFDKQSEYATVIDVYNKEVERQNENNEDNFKYICPNDLHVNSNSNFGQRDIYALGVLFIRILTGDLKPKKDEIDLLNEIEKQYSPELADLLERMISEAAMERPDANTVYSVFKEALEEYK
ncbi:hypothetical protein [Holdemanella biformis]|uniref:hypothetical protein n=1 Tax=Holdemanella biformis TaxID=1735 RepID=UPI002E79677D|nr:hypothetical protein [Holdemanella biformis]